MILETTEIALDTLGKMNDRVLDLVADEIRAFNALPVANLTEEQIAGTVDRLLEVYALLPLTLSKEGFDAWRVRPNSEGELFSDFSDAGPPPPEKANAGRANSEGKSVFYCGASPETCFAESRFSDGDFFHLFRYSLNEGEQLSLVCIGDLDSIRRNGHSILRSPKVDQGYAAILSKVSDDVRLAMQLVDAFFFDQISKKGSPDQYRVTQLVFEAVSSGIGVDGVMYTSVEHAGGFNFALGNEAYLGKVSMISASVNLVKKTYGYGAYRCGSFGPAKLDQANRRLIWPNYPEWAKTLKELD